MWKTYAIWCENVLLFGPCPAMSTKANGVLASGCTIKRRSLTWCTACSLCPLLRRWVCTSKEYPNGKKFFISNGNSFSHLQMDIFCHLTFALIEKIASGSIGGWCGTFLLIYDRNLLVMYHLRRRPPPSWLKAQTIHEIRSVCQGNVSSIRI